MPLSIGEQIDSLGATIAETRCHFQVWEALQEARGDEASARAMNCYREFFASTMLAHFESSVLSCYQLFETRNDTVNFPSLKRALKAIENRDIDQEPELVRIQVEIRPIWVKICEIRNKSVGHLSSEQSQAQIFAHAGLSPKDVWNFLDLTVKLHHGITYPRNQSFEAFNINGKPSTERLISDIKKQRLNCCVRR